MSDNSYGIYRKALEVLKDRPSMMLLFLGANIIGSIVFLVMVGIFGGNIDGGIGLSGRLFFIAFLIGSALQSIAFGSATIMASDYIQGNKTDVWSSLKRTFEMWFQVLTAGLLLSTALAIGLALFLLPGLAVAFLFMFTFVFLMVEERIAVDAMKQSLLLVRAYPKDSLMLLSVLLGLSLIAFIFARLLIIAVPFTGQLITALMLSALFSYTATLLVAFYYEKKDIQERQGI